MSFVFVDLPTCDYLGVPDCLGNRIFKVPDWIIGWMDV